MALAVGERIGPYEVAGLLGAGGMGEVYRARDTKLGRSVALKVLPASLAHDVEYLARFQREAQVLAALNHPHIAAIYGVEANAIVMELVEGRTLAEMGARPLEEALGYARQIAEALEAAHERGIVHRDLKPANVKVTPEGVVKVLDFGLAKAAEAGTVAAAGRPENSPTLTLRATEAGIILGTAGYMAPEQAAGRVVDRRADIWSFGVVLYELLVGQRLFAGESVSETLAAVLKDQIGWEALPANTPASIRELLRRCLDRKGSTRLQAIGEARIAIDRALTEPATVTDPRGTRANRFGWTATGIATTLAVACIWLLWRKGTPVERPLLRFSEDLGSDVTLIDVTNGPTSRTGPTVIISPDGSRLVYLALGKDGKAHLWTRRLSQAAATLLDGTENAQAPFFSPDGKWVGLFAGGKLKKVSLEGGGAQDVGTGDSPMSATWGEDGNIYASMTLTSPIMRIPATGGTPEAVTKLDPKTESSHRWAQLLPNKRAILYAAGIGGRFDLGSIVAQRLDTGERKVLWRNASFPRYLASGHLAFIRNNSVYVVGFDADKLELRGAPVPVLQDVKSAPGSGGAQFDVSREGTLLYRSADQNPGIILSWVDRGGKREDLGLPLARYGSPMLSPDGKRVAFQMLDKDLRSVWIHDLERKQTRRLTFDQGNAWPPRWTPDGERVVYSTTAGMYWTRANGAGRPARLVADGIPLWFSPDGKLLGYMGTDTASGLTCQTVTVEGDPDQPQVGEPKPCLESAATTVRAGADLSPDGHWIAYGATEAGDQQVYIRAFPDRGGRWQVSTSGGLQPRWTADGRRLIFFTPESRLMVADVDVKGDSVTVGAPEPWANLNLGLVLGLGSTLSPSLDGKRVLVPLMPSGEGKPDAHVKVVLNFFDEVRRVLRANDGAQ